MEFELYEDQVVSKFLELDLGFLYEGAPKEAADPSTIATNLLPAELAFTTPPTSSAPATVKGPASTEATSDSSTILLEV